jgi:hypothetical protein
MFVRLQFYNFEKTNSALHRDVQRPRLHPESAVAHYLEMFCRLGDEPALLSDVCRLTSSRRLARAAALQISGLSRRLSELRDSWETARGST